MLPQWYLDTPDEVPVGLPVYKKKYRIYTAKPKDNCMRNTLPLLNEVEYRKACARSMIRNA